MLRQLGAPAPKPQDLIRFYRERATRVHWSRRRRGGAETQSKIYKNQTRRLEERDDAKKW